MTAGWDSTARVWNAESGQLLMTLIGHSQGVMQAVFSPDGNLIATASADKTVRLWDAENGHQMAVYRGHLDMVTGVLFSPDGKLMVSYSEDDTARIFVVDVHEMVKWALHFLPHTTVL